ncbi:MAG: hypothetical protein ABEJ92_02400 [Halobacteriales archaeon]
MPPSPWPDWLDSPAGLATAGGALLAATAALYAVRVFDVSGGLVWVPVHAAVVGFVAAALAGYARRHVVAGLGLAYAPFLGFHLEWALVEISRRPLADRLAYLVRLDGLAALGLEAVVVGAVGYGLGRLARRAAGSLRQSRPAA